MDDPGGRVGEFPAGRKRQNSRQSPATGGQPLGSPEALGAMAGVACLGKAADADEWCDSGLGSLGPDAAAPGGPGLGAELGPGLSWAPLVFGYVTEDGDT